MDTAGVGLVEVVRSAGGFVVSRGGVALVSIRRGTLSVLSVLSGNMRDPRSRGFPFVRAWLGRDLGPFERDPRELIKTKVGRVGGSTTVTFLATWISAFSTEKMDEGEGERVLGLVVGGELGET